MNDEQLLQYSRQILLPELGIDGQQKLINSHVLIIGVGGLGSPAALYLAAAGIGEITLIDDDSVELSNLQRQIIHDMDSLAKSKTRSAEIRLHKINPQTRINSINQRSTEKLLNELLKNVDVVLDCTDNFASRFMINRVCVENHIPLISGAAIRWEGQISSFINHADQPGPCYQCLFQPGGDEDNNCTSNGVIAPLVGIIGSMQAVEAIKLICECGTLLQGRLLTLNALNMQWRSFNFNSDPDCEVCQRGNGNS